MTIPIIATALIPDKKERFRGAHIIGWIIEIIAIFIFIVAAVLGIWDGIRNDFGFPHFYPELKGIVGPHMFGFNKKTHLLHFVIYLPICAVIAWLCTIF